MNQTQLREQVAFAEATAKAMLALGARESRKGYEPGPDSLVVYAGDYTLRTKAGPLIVHAYGDAILTRFEDAEAGKRAVGASVPSGKWNFHLFLVGIDSGKRGEYDRERRLLALFQASLANILE